MEEKLNYTEPEAQTREDPLYSDSAYDDAFRTMEGRCDDILLPFVSHMFQENYGKDAKIRRLRNEHFVEHENGAREKRVTDSYFEITENRVTKTYHLECESKKYDGTILVRIFEYDTQIAKDTADGDPYTLRLRLPSSGLLLLRPGKDTPTVGTIEMQMPCGETVSYSVPIVKVSDYEIEDIFRERLYMLIPFYIFRFEDQFAHMEAGTEGMENLEAQYREMFERLQSELDRGRLSTVSCDAIMKLTKSVAFKLTMKQDYVQRKVGEIMGGKILDLSTFRIFDEGKEVGQGIGLEQGLEQGREPLYSLVQDGFVSLEMAAERSEMTPEEFRQRMEAAGFKVPTSV